MNWYYVLRATLVGNLYHQLRLSGLQPPTIPLIFNLIVLHCIVLYTIYKQMRLAIVMAAYLCYAGTNILAFKLSKPKLSTILQTIAAAIVIQGVASTIQPVNGETVFDCTLDASSKMATYSLSSVG